MLNYGLRERVGNGVGEDGEVKLPAFCLGDSRMARGAGRYAPHRPPVVQSGGFDGVALAGEERIPNCAREISHGADAQYRGRFMGGARSKVDAYLETRLATQRFTEIFESEALRVGSGEAATDGLSNDELRATFGDDGTARNVRLALRLFHFGCPAVYIDQGGLRHALG
ncbi:MAG: hypothetical protein ACI9MR_003658 [Myxococcota bacterium]|jgi:hypothetical protein